MFDIGHVNPKSEHFYNCAFLIPDSNPVEINFLLCLA